MYYFLFKSYFNRLKTLILVIFFDKSVIISDEKEIALIFKFEIKNFTINRISAVAKKSSVWQRSEAWREVLPFSAFVQRRIFLFIFSFQLSNKLSSKSCLQVNPILMT